MENEKIRDKKYIIISGIRKDRPGDQVTEEDDIRGKKKKRIFDEEKETK